MEQEAAVLRIARQELARGRPGRAREHYEALLAEDPDHVEALVGLGYVALTAGSIDEARGLVERLVPIAPDHVEGQILRIIVAEAAGDLAAVDQMVALSEAYPDSCLAAYHAGRLLAATGRGEAALGPLRRAADLVDQVGRRCDILNLMGYVLQDLDRVGEAIRAHRRAVEIHPAQAEAYAGLADACARSGDWNTALAVLDDAVAKVGADDRPAIWQKQAELLASLGDLSAAASLAEQACKRAPRNAQGWLNLSSLRLLDGDTDGAQQAAERAVELAPKAWKPHFQLGMVHDAAARGNRAEVAYRKAVDRAPDRWEPTNNLGLVMLAHGSPADIVEAEQLFRRAAELAGPGEVQPRFNLARTLVRAGRPDDCRQLCEELLAGELSPDLRERLEALVAELS